LDGDGDLDIAAASNSFDQPIIEIRLNSGTATFTTAPFVVLPASFLSGYSIALADLDGDSDPDLVAANFFDSLGSIRLNRGDGTFEASNPPQDIPVPNPLDMVAGDLDGDGDVDLAITRFFGSGIQGPVTILLNDGQGRFGPGPDLEVVGDPSAIEAADL